MSTATRALLWLVALALLPGCFSGLNSKMPAQQRYVLQAIPAVPAAAGEPVTAPTGSLQVMRPSAAPGLEGTGIAVWRPGARLDFYSDSRWGANAPSALQMLVIDSLRNAGRFATVESDSDPFAAQYMLSLELEHFEARYGAAGPPTVEVALVASLGRRIDRSVIVSFTAHSSVKAEDDRMQAVIAAFEQATSETLAQLAANIVPPAPTGTQP
jgi:cholesterol transport system auxiliary component